MSGTWAPPPPPPPAPPRPPIGPVRSPRGLVEVTLEPEMLVLRRHESWRDWLDSEMTLALVAILGVAVAVVGANLDGAARAVLITLGLLLFVPVILFLVLQYVAMVVVFVWTGLRMLTRGGREKLKVEVADLFARFGSTETGWRIPRGDLYVPPAIEGTLRARLPLGTPQGLVVLTAPSWRRSRLEAVRVALLGR